MNPLKLFTIVGIFFTLILGTLLHFTYSLSGDNAIIGLFSAVNESTWEHMKLIFFPMLLYSFFMNHKLKKTNPCVVSALWSGLLIGTLAITVLFYTYTGILGTNYFVADIGVFILGTLIAFSVVYRSTMSCRFFKYQLPLGILVFLFTLAFLWFTYHSPYIGIFALP